MRSTTWMLALALVAMIGATGCGSDDPTPLATAPIDTAPPVLPGGVTVSFDSASYNVIVAWEPNAVDLDFAGFVVERATNGESVWLVEQPVNVTTYADNVQGVGRDVTYRIYSVDQTGNVSAAATAELHIKTPTMHVWTDPQ